MKKIINKRKEKKFIPLDEFINAYVSAKPSNKWSFHINGIEEDNKYKKELVNLVNNYNFQKSVKFNKPEFNIKRKFKIISESWCNVLLSKSEILSLSVLEAFSMGTQSFVNKKIFFPNWIKKYLIRSKVKGTILSNNIQKIMNEFIIETKPHIMLILKQLFSLQDV